MQSVVQYLPSAAPETCAYKAVFPRVGQTKLTINAGAGATPSTLLNAVASGQLPYASGRVSNKGCAEVGLSITYLGGGDCDACTVDSLTTQVLTIVVPGGADYPLPSGLITQITAVTGTTDDSGVFTASNTAKKVVLNWYSYYQPCCDPILVP